MNPVLERLTGESGTDIRRGPAEVVLPGLASWSVETIDQVVTQGAPERLEYEDPLGRWYQVYLYPGAGDRFVLLYENITERKRAELVLRGENAARRISSVSSSAYLTKPYQPEDLRRTVAAALVESLQA